ncbi:MAG TPA: glycosyltransferase family 1 protein, partial [bacterium]
LTVSEYSKEMILERVPGSAGKIQVTPEGVDRRLFKKLRRKPSKLLKILVHGAADERKNIPNILKAARLLVNQRKNFQLVIIGMDQEEMKYTSYLKQTIDLGLSHYVEWGGNVPRWMLNQVYSESDLFLYVSRMEGFGLPVLEAFACGVPVITSNSSSLPEVAGKAALLVDPEKPEDIAKAVKQIMEKPALRRQLIQRGLQRAKLFTWEKMARLTLEVYEKMRGPLN